MLQNKFYTYQVTTGNIARIVNSLGHYNMMIENIEKSDKITDDMKKQLEEFRNAVKELEARQEMFIKVRDEIEHKTFKKYYPSYVCLKDRVVNYIKKYVSKS